MKLPVYEVDGTLHMLEAQEDWTIGTIISYLAEKFGVEESRISIFFRGMLQSNHGMSIRVLKPLPNQYMICNVMEIAPDTTAPGATSARGDTTVLQDMGL